MRTLIFCTSYAASYDEWKVRYLKWLEAIQDSGLSYDGIAIIDDGSPFNAEHTGLRVFSAEAPPDEISVSEVLYLRFSSRLGRIAMLDYPGWWRSFTFSAVFAKKYGFNKIVHVESDAFVISKDLVHWINTQSQGWKTLWSPAQRLPESAIQVICEDQLESFLSLEKIPYASITGMPAEWLLPFTHIERRFKGDRYGEYRVDVPLDADYACNMRPYSAVTRNRLIQRRKAFFLAFECAPLFMGEHSYPSDAWEITGRIRHDSRGPQATFDSSVVIALRSADSIHVTCKGLSQTGFHLEEILSFMKDGSELILNGFQGYIDAHWQSLADHLVKTENLQVALVRFSEAIISLIVLKEEQQGRPDLRDYFNTRINALKLDSYNLLLYTAL